MCSTIIRISAVYILKEPIDHNTNQYEKKNLIRIEFFFVVKTRSLLGFRLEKFKFMKMVNN